MKLKKNNARHYRKILLFLKTMESREIPSNICTIRNETDKKNNAWHYRKIFFVFENYGKILRNRGNTQLFFFADYKIGTKKRDVALQACWAAKLVEPVDQAHWTNAICPQFC
jgi:hypothetical protein